MNMHMYVETFWADLSAERLTQMADEGAAGLIIRDVPDGPLSAILPMLENATLGVVLDVSDAADAEVFLEGLTIWPQGVTLLLGGLPERIAAWHRAAAGLLAAAKEQQASEDAEPAPTVDSAEPDTVATHEAAAHIQAVLPPIMPVLRIRHKERIYTMNPERNLSGFTFYSPMQAGFDGYELVLPGSDTEALSHEQRYEKYDLGRWLGRYIVAMQDAQPICFYMHSETAVLRGGKGLDIEAAAYIRERCGVPVLADGGLATVKHALNFARHGKGLGIVFPQHIYDGSFTLHDVSDYVSAELDRLSDRGSRLSLAVQAGGQLASEPGTYWEQKREGGKADA